MSNDTHADTPVRAFPSVEDCDEAILNPQWVLDHPDEYDIEARVQADKDVRRWTRFREYAVAMRALVAERDEQRDSLLDAIEALGRERARADQAEAALREIERFCDTHQPFASGKSEVVSRRVRDRARAALSAGSGGREICSQCGRDRHGYHGPLCRYCDGTAE